MGLLRAFPSPGLLKEEDAVIATKSVHGFPFSITYVAQPWAQVPRVAHMVALDSKRCCLGRTQLRHAVQRLPNDELLGERLGSVACGFIASDLSLQWLRTRAFH